MNPKINRRRGKDTQKALAKLLRCKDVGTLGKYDLINQLFCVEAKERKQFVAEKWWYQVTDHMKKDPFVKNQIPIVGVHILGKRHDNDFIIIQVKDFLRILEVTGGEEWDVKIARLLEEKK